MLRGHGIPVACRADLLLPFPLSSFFQHALLGIVGRVCNNGAEQDWDGFNPVRHEICAFSRTPQRWYCAIFQSAHNLWYGR
jgi:hypothetical protein